LPFQPFYRIIFCVGERKPQTRRRKKMKVYYEVYKSAKVTNPFTGKGLVDGSKLVLRTKSRRKAFFTLNTVVTYNNGKYDGRGFIDEITDYGNGNESVDTIA
jgi:hypothetical protein